MLIFVSVLLDSLVLRSKFARPAAIMLSTLSLSSAFAAFFAFSPSYDGGNVALVLRQLFWIHICR